MNKTKTISIPSIEPAVEGEPIPPKWHARTAEHHWLLNTDMDGHTFGLVVLQWCPSARRWTHSGNVGTGMYVPTKYWVYKGLCPIPGFD